MRSSGCFSSPEDLSLPTVGSENFRREVLLTKYPDFGLASISDLLSSSKNACFAVLILTL
ncbi:hypothetical protein D3C87_1191830 [compost metagenome]